MLLICSGTFDTKEVRERQATSGPDRQQIASAQTMIIAFHEFTLFLGQPLAQTRQHVTIKLTIPIQESTFLSSYDDNRRHFVRQLKANASFQNNLRRCEKKRF